MPDFLFPPLKKMRLTQPFGVDYLGNNGPGGKSYADIGLAKGHNGWDLSAQTGTEVFAACDGEIQYTEGGQGFGNDMRLRSRADGLEIVHGHLLDAVAKSGPVKRGDLIAHTNNTGFSTGPHLHWGVRKIFWRADGSGPYVENYDNGFYGYIDPTPLFSPDVFDLPVDQQYGLTNQTPGVPSEIEWMKTNVWFFKNLKRLMSPRERNAFRYGFWDLRTVLDPAMYQVWTEMTKPEAVRRGIAK